VAIANGYATLAQIKSALRIASGDATDDAGMVERMGVIVQTVPGHEEAFKITRPLDLVLAEAILARRRAAGGVG